MVNLAKVTSSCKSLITTGLVTVSVYDTYNIDGQFEIMLLIQISGVGYMTFS